MFPAVLLITSLFLTASAQTTGVATAVAQKQGLKAGDKAPDFQLKGVDGQTYGLQQIAASGKDVKGFIVVFTCNTCPFAQRYESRIIELHNKMTPKGYPVVAIQPNDPALIPGDSYANMQKRASEKQYPFVYLFDEGQEVFPQYGAERTPTVYLLDKNLTVRYTGAIDDNANDAAAAKRRYVEEAIAAIEAKKEVATKETKSIGCGIKSRKIDRTN